jgi:hypothetical protein
MSSLHDIYANTVFVTLDNVDEELAISNSHINEGNLHPGVLDGIAQMLLVLPDTTVETHATVHKEYKEISNAPMLENSLVTILKPVRGNKQLYVPFELCRTLKQYVSHCDPDSRKEMLPTLYKQLVIVSKIGNSAVAKMKDNVLPYVFVGSDEEPKFLLHPNYSSNIPSFSQMYNQEQDFLFEVGCVLYFVYHGTFPGTEGTMTYNPPPVFTNEFEFIIDKLIDRRGAEAWDLETFHALGPIVASHTQKARFLINLIMNCKEEQKDAKEAKKDPDRTIKNNLIKALDKCPDDKIYFSPITAVNASHNFHSAVELLEMENINDKITRKNSRRSKPIVFTNAPSQFIKLFRHFTKHCWDPNQNNYEQYQQNFLPTTENFVRGDFMVVVEGVLPVFFIYVFHIARQEVASLHYLFSPTE